MNKKMPSVRKILLSVILSQITDTSVSKKLKIAAKRRKKQKNLFVMLFSTVTTLMRRHIPKNLDYVDIINEMPNDVFENHFRMNREVFQFLREELEGNWNYQKTGRPSVTLNLSLYVTIWMLSNQTTYRVVSDRFNLAIGLVHKIVLQVCKMISQLKTKHVKWPNENEVRRIKKRFDKYRGSNSFPNVIGCVDGTHIAINQPTEDARSYCNRKSFYSLILQVVCDDQLRIMDVFFGWPGSAHDACVWRNSPLGSKLISGSLGIPPDWHILGDSAYPLHENLLVPYKDNGYLSESQSNFNYRHSSTRICVENAIGLLKNKFQILKHLNIKKLNNAKYFVTACIVLHNIIINHKFQQLPASSLPGVQSTTNVISNYDNPKQKRDLICRSLSL